MKSIRKVFLLLLLILPLTTALSGLPEPKQKHNEVLQKSTQVKTNQVNIEKIKQLKVQFLIESIIQVESNGKHLAINIKEDAVGVFQIRRIMVQEVNRIIGSNTFTFDDRFNPDKSLQMFIIIQGRYNPTMDLEIAARSWNGGLRGMSKRTTLPYYYKVKGIFDQKKEEYEKQHGSVEWNGD